VTGTNVGGGESHNPSQGITAAFAWRKLKDLSQGSWSPGSQKFNLRPPIYETEVLTIQHLVASKNFED
jgi:hypothetical protein